MYQKKQNNIIWSEFELLRGLPIKQGVFHRQGGHSKGAFHALNASLYVGDDIVSVQKNHQLIQQALQLPHLISLKQVHGKEVHHIKEPSNSVLEGDALMTKQKNCCLMVMHADCQATIFYDSIQHAVAIAHAGWRGSVLNIYKETIEAMKRSFQTQPKDLFVCISPSLGPDNAEFIHYQKELPDSFWCYQSRPTYFNFWEISRQQLLEEGILDHHIEIAQICTYANEKDFFSYRRENITGRNATVVMLT